MSAGEVAAQSLLDLDLGFLALPRRLCASPFFSSLRPDERWVFVQMLLAARYAEGGEFWFAGTRIQLAPGQFIETQEQIAAGSGSTRKTVRTVYRKAKAAGLITWARVLPAGQCPSVTTVINYERIRFDAARAGQRNGQQPGHEGATNGPAVGPLTGHEGAPSEQGRQGEPGNPGKFSLVPEADASDDAGPFGRVIEVWNRVCAPAGFSKARSTPQQRKAARTRMREPGWFEAFTAACTYVAGEPFYRGGSSSGWVLTLGWLLEPSNAEKTAERAATRKAPPAAASVTAARSTGAASPNFTDPTAYAEVSLREGT
jgi:hypothetical protein